MVINVASVYIASEHARACALEVQSCDYTALFCGRGRGWMVKLMMVQFVVHMIMR
jgi:hypothetical protein